MHNYWLVVDTLRISNAIKRVTDNFNVTQVQPLYAGTQLSYLNEFSPHLFNLGSEQAVLKTWGALENFDTSSVMFYVESEQQADFLAHLQSLLIIDINQTPTLLRFYTHRFWQTYRAQFTAQDIDTLLGVATSVYWYENAELKNLSHKPSGTPSEYQLQLSAAEFKEQ